MCVRRWPGGTTCMHAWCTTPMPRHHARAPPRCKTWWCGSRRGATSAPGTGWAWTTGRAAWCGPSGARASWSTCSPTCAACTPWARRCVGQWARPARASQPLCPGHPWNSTMHPAGAEGHGGGASWPLPCLCARSSQQTLACVHARHHRCNLAVLQPYRRPRPTGASTKRPCGLWTRRGSWWQVGNFFYQLSLLLCMILCIGPVSRGGP